MDNNTIKKNGVDVYAVDTFSDAMKEGNSFVINTDMSTGSGIHYIVLYCHNNECYIIDPLGKSNYRMYDDVMFDIVRNNSYDTKFYPYKFQMTDSSKCGYFAISVVKLIKRLRRKYKDVSFDVVKDEIVKKFGKTADPNDEEELKKEFGMNKGWLDRYFDN
jgi:hypothetical protein